MLMLSLSTAMKNGVSKLPITPTAALLELWSLTITAQRTYRLLGNGTWVTEPIPGAGSGRQTWRGVSCPGSRTHWLGSKDQPWPQSDAWAWSGTRKSSFKDMTTHPTWESICPPPGGGRCHLWLGVPLCEYETDTVYVWPALNLGWPGWAEFGPY